LGGALREHEVLVDEQQVLRLVLETVSREADDLGYDELRAPTAETPLFGGEAGVDSLSLVRLVAAVERAAEVHFGKNIVLADERAMSMRSSPFRTVGALANLLHQRLATVDA
jgi:acyl carrier protein